MIEAAIAVSLCVTIVMVAMVLGCMKAFRKVFKFKKFKNDEEGRIATTYNGSLPSHIMADEISGGDVSFEPLPEIRKPRSIHKYRPRIVQGPGDQSFTPPKEVDFDVPREKLFFIKELGNGWFGQVIQGEAVGLISGQSQLGVVICTLKDEATENDTKVFHDEVNPYRCLNHRNVLSFMGHSTTAMPHLSILEHASNGDLKSYMLKHRNDLPSIKEHILFLKFAVDIASGLSCLHRHNFIHRDLACRNCQVMTDCTVKIGDYGLSEELYKDDYIDVARDMLPLRWLPTDTIHYGHGENIILKPITQSSNIWSLGVTLWELCSVGAMPYSQLNNSQVLKMFSDTSQRKPLPLPTLSIDCFPDLYEVMKSCWSDPRPSITDVCTSLNLIVSKFSDDKIDEFDEKWSSLATPEKSGSSTNISIEASIEAAELESDILFIKDNSMVNKNHVLPMFKTNAIDIETPEKSSILPRLSSSTPLTKGDISGTFISAQSSLANTPDIDSFVTANNDSFSLQNISDITAHNGSVTLIGETPEKQLIKSPLINNNSEVGETLYSTPIINPETVQHIHGLNTENTVNNNHAQNTPSQTLAAQAEAISSNNTSQNSSWDVVRIDELQLSSQSTEILSIESGIVDGGEDTDESDSGLKNADMNPDIISDMPLDMEAEFESMLAVGGGYSLRTQSTTLVDKTTEMGVSSNSSVGGKTIVSKENGSKLLNIGASPEKLPTDSESYGKFPLDIITNGTVNNRSSNIAKSSSPDDHEYSDIPSAVNADINTDIKPSILQNDPDIKLSNEIHPSPDFKAVVEYNEDDNSDLETVSDFDVDAISSDTKTTNSNNSSVSSISDTTCSSNDTEIFGYDNITYKTVDCSNLTYYQRSPTRIIDNNSPLPTIPEDAIVVLPMATTPARPMKQIDHRESFDSFDTYEWDDEIGNELIGQVHDLDMSSITSPRVLHELQADWTLDLADSSRNNATEDSMDGSVINSLSGPVIKTSSEEPIQPAHNSIVNGEEEAATRM